MDADSVEITELQSFRHSEANIIPLNSVLKSESKELELETPKKKVMVTSGMKNISPFHQIIEPLKTGSL